MVLTVKPVATASLSVTGPNPTCAGSPSAITFTGTSNSIVTYKVNSGANQTINIGPGGTTILNTGNLSANTTYTLVNVAYPGLPCTQTLNQFVTVNVTSAPTAVAGTISPICSNSGAVNITTGASATNASSISWTSNGTGTITNSTSINGATYTPGAGESGLLT
jgi:hypothetical protein